MHCLVRGLFGIDIHAADRILDHADSALPIAVTVSALFAAATASFTTLTVAACALGMVMLFGCGVRLRSAAAASGFHRGGWILVRNGHFQFLKDIN